MISLLSLPISTIRLVFTRFLKIKDISRLDVAYCNHDERDHLLHILSDNKYIIYDNVVMKGDHFIYRYYRFDKNDEDNVKYINSALIWIDKRKVNILNLSILCHDSLTYVGLAGLSQHCKYLQSLTIKGCPNISGNGIVEISKKCSTNLQTLSLSNSDLHDIHVVDFISNCSNIRSLDLSGLGELNDTGIILIARTLQRNLKSLDLQSCHKISDFGFIEMGKLCSLEKLTISRWYDETPQEFLKFRDFDEVLKSFNNLLSLTIEGNVGSDAVDAIGKYCTNLHSLKLLDGEDLKVNDFVNIDSLCSNLQCIELGNFRALSKLRRLLPNLQIISCDNYKRGDDYDDDSDNNDNDNDD